MFVHFAEKDQQVLALIEDMKEVIQVIEEQNEICLLSKIRFLSYNKIFAGIIAQ